MNKGDQVFYRAAEGEEPLCALVAKAVSDTEANLCVVNEDGTTQAVRGAVLFSDPVSCHTFFVPAKKPEPVAAQVYHQPRGGTHRSK